MAATDYDDAAAANGARRRQDGGSGGATAVTRGSPYLPTARENLLLAVFPAILLFGALFSVLSPQTRAAAAAAAAAAEAAAAVGSEGDGGGGGATAAHFPQGGPGAVPAPSYFARKDNVLNVLFVKRGWFWISVVFFGFVATHPSFSAATAAPGQKGGVLGGGRRRLATALVRWGLVTGWWILVTQWCFGPALIDRSFRLTGGGCEALQAATAAAAEAAAAAAEAESEAGGAGVSPQAERLLAAATAAACKRGGGRWRGGHDISGHVFMLVLGTSFLAQELGWVLWRQVRRAAAGSATTGAGAAGGGGGGRAVRVVDTRTLVLPDGAVKSAEVEAGLDPGAGGLFPGEVGGGGAAASGHAHAHAHAASASAAAFRSRLALRAAAVVVALSLWMLLMTAIYFHTWSEKLSGLLVALAGFYGVYVVPRWLPAVRRVVGVPGL